jgi:hypothetical protein
VLALLGISIPVPLVIDGTVDIDRVDIEAICEMNCAAGTYQIFSSFGRQETHVRGRCTSLISAGQTYNVRSNENRANRRHARVLNTLRGEENENLRTAKKDICYRSLLIGIVTKRQSMQLSHESFVARLGVQGKFSSSSNGENANLMTPPPLLDAALQLGGARRLSRIHRRSPDSSKLLIPVTISSYFCPGVSSSSGSIPVMRNDNFAVANVFSTSEFEKTSFQSTVAAHSNHATFCDSRSTTALLLGLGLRKGTVVSKMAAHISTDKHPITLTYEVMLKSLGAASANEVTDIYSSARFGRATHPITWGIFLSR